MVGRVGSFAKGIVCGILGGLAIAIAVNGGGARDVEASPSGALAKIANSPAASTGLWLLAIGLGVHAIWCLVSALLPGRKRRPWMARSNGTESQRRDVRCPLVDQSIVRAERHAGQGFAHHDDTWRPGAVGMPDTGCVWSKLDRAASSC